MRITENQIILNDNNYNLKISVIYMLCADWLIFGLCICYDYVNLTLAMKNLHF